MKKPSMISVLLFLTGLLCIFSLFFFSKNTIEQILSTEKEVDAIIEQFTDKQAQIQTATQKYTSAADTIRADINRLKQKQQTATQGAQHEKADVLTDDAKPSIFSQQNSASADMDMDVNNTDIAMDTDPNSIFSSGSSMDN